MPTSSEIVSWYGPVRLLSVSGGGRRDIRSALPFAVPWRCAKVYVYAENKSQPKLDAGFVLPSFGISSRLS